LSLYRVLLEIEDPGELSTMVSRLADASAGDCGGAEGEGALMGSSG
jgi:hypothetical protein